MARSLLTVLFMAATSCGVWQLATDAPVVPPVVCGLFLLLLGLIAGLRVGSDSATHIVDDLVRLNQTLGDQNQELSEMNLWLVKRLRAGEFSNDFTEDKPQ